MKMKEKAEETVRGTMEYYDKSAVEWAERGYAQDAELECLKDFLDMLYCAYIGGAAGGGQRNV